jgi:hypothetical protein
MGFPSRQSIAKTALQYRQMKPLPPPSVPGDTEAARMDNAVRMLFCASKESFVKQETKQRARNRKKRAKRSAA